MNNFIERLTFAIKGYRRRQVANAGAFRKVIFIAGLPKSGSTWLENLFVAVPGFRRGKFPPYITIHDHDLREEMFDSWRFDPVVVKLHTNPDDGNIAILDRLGVKYCITYRDLRDVAVSFVFYVKNVAREHWLHENFNKMDNGEALHYFIKEELPAYANWVRDWTLKRDQSKSTTIQYESLLMRPVDEFCRVAGFFDLDLSSSECRKIVESQQFEKKSGRRRGEEDQQNFLRKGVAGDWRVYFDKAHKEKFKEIAGDWLIEFGYEKGMDW